MKNKKTKAVIVTTLMIAISSANLYFLHFNQQSYFLLFLIPSILSMLLLLWRFGWVKLNEKNLFNQPLFLISILLPLYYALMFGLWVWKDPQVTLSSEGYLNFITNSKLPLLILALSVPFASIINNIHRTIQTERQIFESERKNNFDISINHIKYYTELFQKIESEEITEAYKVKSSTGDEDSEIEFKFTPIVQYPSSLYKKLFISNNTTHKNNLQTNPKFLNKIKNDWKYLNQCFRRLNNYDKFLHSVNSHGKFRAAKCKIYYETCDAYETLCNTLELGNYRPQISFISEDKDDVYQIWIPFYNQRTLYKSIKSIEKLSLKIFDIIRDENVEEYFSAKRKLFIYGPGAIHDWSHFMSERILAGEAPSRISRSSGSLRFIHSMAAIRRQNAETS
ncbi:hypothetical protein [Enterobacter cloacae]|uniref:hypothetical protein n=1 Tax=Enterobacter cloacae TaxID=550 RepID=UPI001C96EF68|nr:hypothetical protein [Enterobacter cloacae]MBY5119790.1 hypothetical protein [Enterobacter cloacae]